MDKQTLIELIKIASPYVIAILGILSPLFTTKYLNKEDFRKYKKQRNFDKYIKIYSILITELSDIKRTCEYIVKMAEYYEHKDENTKYEKLFHKEDNSKSRLKEVVKFTIKYDETIKKCQKSIREILNENFIFLQDDIIKKVSSIVDIYDSPIPVFEWGIPVMYMRNGEFNINLENIRAVYVESSKMFKDMIINVDNIIIELKHEITGEK